MRILWAVALSLALTACKPNTAKQEQDFSSDSGPIKGDILMHATLGDTSSLVPMLSGDVTSSYVAGLIYTSLLTYDKDINLVPKAAESYHISNNGKTITFKLKQDIKFEDGTPLTAHDVMATYQFIIDEKTRTPYASKYKMVQKAEVLDDYTFRVNYAEPFAPALSSWAMLILPKHILEKSKDDYNKTELKETPLGVGPYKLYKWRRGQDLSLKSTSDRPHIAGQRMRIIPDADATFLELKAGNLDHSGLKPLQYLLYKDKESFTNRFNLFSYLSNAYTYMGFNLKNPLFQDIKIRQALSFATPRDALVKGVLHGQGQPASTIFKPGTWAYNNSIKPYPYNLEKAKELLKEAGWVDTNNDGILDKDGQDFRFTIITNQGNSLRLRTAEILQYAFSQLGIEVKIRTQEWSTFITNTINKSQFDAIIMGWSLSAEPDPYSIWHSSQIKEGQFNFIHYKNKEVDQLIEKARAEMVQEKRKVHLDRLQEILHQEQPYLFLYVPYSNIAVHKRIKNVYAAPSGIDHNMEDWYVPQELQRYSINQLMP